MWLACNIIFSPTNPQIWQVYEHYRNIEDMFYALKEHKCEFLDGNQKRSMHSDFIKQAENIIKQCLDKNIDIITYDDSCYPKKFYDLYNPPSVIFSVGDKNLLNCPLSAAIVGSREISLYSADVTEYYASSFAVAGINVVSGFAKGTDSIAHQSAIKSGGKTIAVLGSGILYDYPKNSMKFKKLIKDNGVVISEYYPYTVSLGQNFKIRNRLISALSDSVTVIQAGEKSGALNTVSHALEQGKDVYVFPPQNIFDPHYFGQSELIKEGAFVTVSPEDVIIDMINKLNF